MCIFTWGFFSSLFLWTVAHVEADSITWSGSIYNDTKCTHEIAKDWLQENSPMQVELGSCDLSFGMYEKYFCRDDKVMVETVHHDAKCEGESVYTIIFKQGACVGNPITPQWHFKTHWTDGCGAPQNSSALLIAREEEA